MGMMYGTNETKLQHAARLLKQYSDMFKGTHPLVSKEMSWLADVVTGEDAEMVEMDRLLLMAKIGDKPVHQ